MCSMRFHVVFASVIIILVGATEAIVYQCENYDVNGEYNSRYCALYGVVVVHDAQDVDFTSDYPRPYRFEFRLSNLSEIPRALFTAFPEMQSLDLSETGIEIINKFTFENAKQLRKLMITYNRLTSLTNYIFKGCDQLEELDLSHNELQELKENTFSEIETVNTLRLSSNQLTSLPENVFFTLPNLVLLTLSDNLLTTLSEHMFSKNPLTMLDLGKNRLLHVHLHEIRTMLEVTLSENRLTNVTLPPYAKTVNISHNSLSTIHVLPGGDAVEWLSLAHNMLTDIGNISTLRNLHTLDVSFNALRSLPLTTFLHLSQLQMLNLEATNLTSMEHGLFSSQKNLKWLDISYNQLQKLDLTVLTPALYLQTLHIDGNNLTDIEYSTFKELFTSLIYLGLFDNSWNCSYLVDLVSFCRRYSIQISATKQYGTVYHVSNIQGIYCAGSRAVHLPGAIPVEHSMDRQDIPPSNDRTAAQLAKQLNELHQIIDRLERELSQKDPSVSNLPLGTCSALDVYNYQVFMLLILSMILILNVSFLLYVYRNANARRSVDRMIIFRRNQGGSIQTELNGEL
ncbi:carboxypeptidase N subunit 2-like [Anopheles nili]|uniref:carboxypeptidase N subunit 2-like n=1 Tax=Anopheles nili TaxID=185578 RepID=UPI00237B1B7F|nr:carboxypeptidase N subunit 2-like [Anopheles nili]